MAEEVQETPWLQEGMIVEMRSDQEGYQGAWFTVKIINVLCHKKNRVCRQVVVEHLDFIESNEPGSKKHQETVKKDHLRPLPPKLPNKQWKKRDAVETLQEGAWWVGYIKQKIKKDTYLVYYGQGYEDLEIAASDVRTRQDYVRKTFDWNISAAMQTPPADWEETPSKRRESNYSRDEEWDKDEDKQKKKPKLGATIGKHR